MWMWHTNTQQSKTVSNTSVSFSLFFLFLLFFAFFRISLFLALFLSFTIFFSSLTHHHFSSSLFSIHPSSFISSHPHLCFTNNTSIIFPFILQIHPSFHPSNYFLQIVSFIVPISRSALWSISFPLLPEQNAPGTNPGLLSNSLIKAPNQKKPRFGHKDNTKTKFNDNGTASRQ